MISYANKATRIDLALRYRLWSMFHIRLDCEKDLALESELGAV